MQRISRSLIACVFLAAATLIFSSGCEDADTDVEQLGDYQSASRDAKYPPAQADGTPVEDLTITPAEATLSRNGDMVAFTAKGGSPPYSWAVQDVFRGSVVDPVGDSTAYQRSSAGDNAVSVTDSAGRKAYAIVSQP